MPVSFAVRLAIAFTPKLLRLKAVRPMLTVAPIAWPAETPAFLPYLRDNSAFNGNRTTTNSSPYLYSTVSTVAFETSLAMAIPASSMLFHTTPKPKHVIVSFVTVRWISNDRLTVQTSARNQQHAVGCRRVLPRARRQERLDVRLQTLPDLVRHHA